MIKSTDAEELASLKDFEMSSPFYFKVIAYVKKLEARGLIVVNASPEVVMDLLKFNGVSSLNKLYLYSLSPAEKTAGEKKAADKLEAGVNFLVLMIVLSPDPFPLLYRLS